MTAADLSAWLVDTTLATSALIVLILLARRPVARHFGAECAYLLWSAPALRLMLPELKILPAPATSPSGVGYAAEIISWEAAPATMAAAPWTAELVLAGLWIAGACFFLFRQIAAQRAFTRRVFARSTPADAGLCAELRAVAAERGLNRRIALRVSDACEGPLILGMFRPLIILPADFQSHYSPDERRISFAHELAHAARGDLYAAGAATLFRALFWFNPLVHVASAAFRADQEAACDRDVLARSSAGLDAAAYVRAILKSARAAPAPAGLSINFALKERLMTMNTHTPKRSALKRAIFAATALVCVGATASYGRADDPDAKPRATSGDKEAVEIRAKKVVVDKDGKRAIFLSSEDDSHPVIVDLMREMGAGDSDRKVIVLKGGAHDGDAFEFVGSDGEILSLEGANCTSADGKPIEPLVDETVEEKEGDRRYVSRIVHCETGDGPADPKKTAEALRKAVAQMREEADREAQTRAKIIATLEARIAELEKDKAKK